jgi:hypothetical protein
MILFSANRRCSASCSAILNIRSAEPGQSCSYCAKSSGGGIGPEKCMVFEAEIIRLSLWGRAVRCGGGLTVVTGSIGVTCVSRLGAAALSSVGFILFLVFPEDDPYGRTYIFPVLSQGLFWLYFRQIMPMKADRKMFVGIWAQAEHASKSFPKCLFFLCRHKIPL